MGLKLLLFFAVAMSCRAEVIVHDRVINATIDDIYDLPSTFGPGVGPSGLKGVMRIASPILGCQPILPPPPFPSYMPPSNRHWIVLIRRGNCTFATKVSNGQAAGYAAVIVMDNVSDYIEPMSASEAAAENITIPSVIVGRQDGTALLNYFKNYRRFSLIITEYIPMDIEKYLLPFASTIGVCFLAMLCIMLVKCVKDYRKSRKHRLSWRELRRLPTLVYNSATDEEVYEVCAICLEEYVNGDKLRILPCRHGYHSRCIDPWLTKRRRVCPVCKAKVRPSGRTVRDDHSDSDDSGAEAAGGTERAPLLQQAAQESAQAAQPDRAVSAGNTFAPVAENPFQRAARLLAARRGYTNMAADDGEAGHAGDGDARVDGDGAMPSTSGAPSSAVMLPGADDALADALEVVTVTRKKKRKTKKNLKTDSPGSSSTVESSVRRPHSTVVNMAESNTPARDDVYTDTEPARVHVTTTQAAGRKPEEESSVQPIV